MRKACSIALAAVLGIASPALVAQSASADQNQQWCPEPPGVTTQNGCVLCPPGVTSGGCIPDAIWGAGLVGGGLLAGVITLAVVNGNHQSQVSP